MAKTVLGGYWESAYRSGHVPWDPGEYDKHLPRILKDHGLEPGPALDIGCGEGKSAVWLASRGFDVLGVDVAPTAIQRAQAHRGSVPDAPDAGDPSAGRMPAGRVPAGRMPAGRAHFAVAAFPDDVPALAPEVGAEGGFRFIMERGLLQHMRSPGDHAPFLEAVAEWLAPEGLFYALIAKREGAHRFAGPPTWTEEDVRSAVAPALELVELRGSVFTPEERGSIPAWVVVARRSR